ncbi:cytochrome-c peroxidase [Zooshikella ganghwensis]|uniref:Cytochrome C peroxidase n=1 Tax=Zooshikella ganghwensis TaxID=202772 RepID=A0A4P9VJK5_9GAMM|nr:cytochrome c peroxidase [Zooshikella ganghwensis]RDH43455.1 cytochrome C peroxidase [Zooshikella ganghwensis]
MSRPIKIKSLYCLLVLWMLSGHVHSDINLYQFSAADIQFLSQFNLSNLPPLPDAQDNQYADSLAAATIGQQLFFDKRFSANQQVSCASCHKPQQYFTDGLAVSKGMGETRRNAPSIIGSAYSPWQFWDGRKDSLWSQALGPMESDVEHGLSRLEVVQVFIQHYLPLYRELITKTKGAANTLPRKYFQQLKLLLKLKIPASPNGVTQAQINWQTINHAEQNLINRVFADVGKLLMAYQRQIQPLSSRFDLFVRQLENNSSDIEQLKQILTENEVAGLRLFMGKGNCASCHNGPLFTNFEFHNIGAPESDIKQVDMGRYEGVAALLKDEFTCLSSWSDADKNYCQEMLYLKKQGPELVGAFKTPSLRNVAETAPYMQSGQFASLDEVLEHYNKPTPPYYDREQHPFRPHFDILPLGLTPEELQQIKSFLLTLTGDLKLANQWWQAPKHMLEQTDNVQQAMY